MGLRFCPLCGITVPPVRGALSGQVPTLPLEWYQELRVVRSVEGISSPFVTGIGFYSYNGLVNAHSDYDTNYTDSTVAFTDSDVYRPLYGSDQFWAFTLHSACWDILLIRLGKGQQHRLTIGRHLFYVLLSTIWDESTYLIKEYDYGEAARFHKSGQEAFRLMNHGGLFYSSYLSSNPCQFDGFKAAVSVADQFPPAKMNEITYHHSIPRPQENFFSRLPVEIIHMVLTWLSSKDVCNLRLAWRRFAVVSTVRALPGSFWSSRFRPCFEMGFALPFVDEHAKFVDWREMYFAINRTLQSPEGWGPIRQRKRIWVAVSPVLRLIESLLINSHRRGIPSAWDDISALSTEDSLNLSVGHVVRGLSVPDSHPTVLFEGCREIETRNLIWPELSERKECTIGISLVSLDNGTFVSGIRILQNHAPIEKINAQHSLGLIRKDSETLVHVERNTSLEGFEAAVCPEGIVGLKPILGGHDCVYPGYIGSVSQRRPDIAFGRLIPRQGKRIFALSAGIDVSKLTSIGLIEDNQNPGSLEELSKLHLTKPHPTVEDILWTPSIPSHNTSIHLFPTTAISKKFQPFLNVNFGGVDDGSRLSSLTRVVAHMNRLPYLITGFEFFYSKFESKLCGSRGSLERSFLVDGAGGERISKVDVQLSSELEHVNHIQSLEISTNWENIVTVGYPEVQTTEHHPPSVVLKPADGEAIYGFILGMAIRAPIFHSFGLQTQRIPPQVCAKPAGVTAPEFSHPLVYSLDASTASIYRFSSRTLYTRTSLNNIRRICFSWGVNERLRRDTNISGLWINFQGSSSPVIVGQWFAEAASFDLGEAEQITEVSTWVSRDFSEGINGPHLGRVVGISLSTSLGRSSGFVGSRKEGTMRLRFRANRFENLDSLMWAYNHEVDHVRVITKRANVSHDLILCPKDSASWIVPEKIFLQNGNDDNLDEVATVQVYSKPGAIIGLSFVYTSGTTSGIGSTQGDIESFEARDRRLTCLQVHSTKDIIKELTFHTELVGDDQEDDQQPIYMKKKSHTFIASSAGEPPPPNHSMYDLLESAKPRVQHASSRSTNHIHKEELIPARRTSFVGLWGIGNELRKLGVILENCDSDN